MSVSAKISFISGPLASTYSLFAVLAFFLTFTSELATPPSLIGSVSPADFPLAQPMGSMRRRQSRRETIGHFDVPADLVASFCEPYPAFIICVGMCIWPGAVLVHAA